MLFDRGKLRRLAEAGAFDRFALTRRQALWTVRGCARLPLEGGRSTQYAAALSTADIQPAEPVGSRSSGLLSETSPPR